MRILVIDDVRALATIARQILEMQGHDVAVAYDAVSALEAAEAFRPELVLCDLNLDVGMSGYEVAKRLRADERFRDVYLVALTGYDGESECQQSCDAGFNNHVVKPLLPEVLERIVSEAIAWRGVA